MTDLTSGRHDWAVLGTLIHTGARVGAVFRLRIQDLRDHGNRALQFAEKGGKVREISVHRDLDEWLAGGPKDSGPFRAGKGRDRPLTGESLTPHALERMLKRRLATAGLPEILSPHSFRVLVVTDPHRFNGSTQMAVHACLVRQSYRQKQSFGFSGDRASLWIFSAWP